MSTLPVTTQTAYAELLDQLVARDAQRSIGDAPGTFTEKDVKGKTYVYFQFSAPGGEKRQSYIGPKSRELTALVKRFAKERAERVEDEARIAELVAILRAGGAATIDTASGRVIEALEKSGVFKLGGVLVGTHAYVVLGNVLGVKWTTHARTEDIDVALERVLQIAVPELETDLPAAIESLAMGFLPVPAFSPKDPSTSFKVRGKGLRVDLITPAAGERSEKPVPIPRLRAAAAPLRYLDYLIEDPILAAVLGSTASLVRVPSPARFALHKTIVAQQRSASFQSKAEKDLAQAGTLIEALAEHRPGDLGVAWTAAFRRGGAWARMLNAAPKRLARIAPRASEELSKLAK